MTREEILLKKREGDWVTVGKMLNCTSDCARFRFRRPNSKHYPAVFNAIVKVIEAREQIIDTHNANISK